MDKLLGEKYNLSQSVKEDMKMNTEKMGELEEQVFILRTKDLAHIKESTIGSLKDGAKYDTDSSVEALRRYQDAQIFLGAIVSTI